MADVSDVLTALKALLVVTLYPLLAGPSAIGFDAVVGIGWPDDTELQKVLASGRALVSIYPLDGERGSTEWEFSDQEVPRPPPGVALAFDIGTNTATISVTTTTTNDVIGIVYNDVAYTVNLTAGMTATDVAAKIVATLAIITGSTATAVGNVVMFGNGNVAAVTADNNGLTMLNVGTIERRLQISCWSFDQASRDKLLSVLIPALRFSNALNVPVPNGTVELAYMEYSAGSWSDRSQSAGGYMRSVIMQVTFQTTIYNPAFTILFTGADVNGVVAGYTLWKDLSWQL